MTNPPRTRSVLCDGTVPNYQDCVVEEAATLYPGYMVVRNSTHSPNGVIAVTAEDPAVNTNTFDLGVIEVEEVAIYTTTKYDWATAIPDNYHCLVHWLSPGDIFLPTITDPAATLAIGSQMVLDTGVWKKPDAVAAFDVNIHVASVQRTVVTTDTIAKLRYLGFGPADAA